MIEVDYQSNIPNYIEKKILYAILNDENLTYKDLGIMLDQFYDYIMQLADNGLIIEIPDPKCESNNIKEFSIDGIKLTQRGKRKLLKFEEEEKQLLNKVFLVHGHDDALKNEVARALEKAGLSVVILHEKANEGLTIFQKFEKHAQNAGYAVVLMTPDDRGKAKEEKRYNDRARQNVILEWGYFAGKLGADKVCAIHTGTIEPPSDIQGILYIPYSKDGGWKLELYRNLEAAGYVINWHNI